MTKALTLDEIERELGRPCKEEDSRRIRHFRQRDTWDCGVACLCMVLPETSWEEVALACGTESIWTIDLAVALRSFGASFIFSTKTIGCDPSYRRLPFYSRENVLCDDETRVARLFDTVDFPVYRATVSDDVLISILRAGYCVIALVDLKFLRPLPTYTGHYVVLHGVRKEDGYILYHDPAADDSQMARGDDINAISPSDLHTARTAYGTDQDLLIVRVSANRSTRF